MAAEQQNDLGDGHHYSRFGTEIQYETRRYRGLVSALFQSLLHGRQRLLMAAANKLETRQRNDCCLNFEPPPPPPPPPTCSRRRQKSSCCSPSIVQRFVRATHRRT
jgi:hypothetical protein